jgi:acyl-ACP thioesterase
MSEGVWKEKREVESFEVDTKGRLRPYVLFSFMINSAWKHASAVGFGYQDLAERKLMWVLSEFQLRIAKLPLWRDGLFIETWGKRIERFYALRDFAVHSEGGEKLAVATGAWMILDKESYRPQRLEQLMASFPWQVDKSELETKLKRIQESSSTQDRKHYQVLFSDLDANNHVNAAKYLQWIMDSYPREILEHRQLETVDMSFLIEATIDEEIAIYFEQKDCQDVNSVKRVKDLKDVCRAVIRWKQ